MVLKIPLYIRFGTGTPLFRIWPILILPKLTALLPEFFFDRLSLDLPWISAGAIILFLIRVEMSDPTALMPDWFLFCQQFRSALEDRELLWASCKQRRVPQILGLYWVLRSAGLASAVIANLWSFSSSIV